MGTKVPRRITARAPWHARRARDTVQAHMVARIGPHTCNVRAK